MILRIANLFLGTVSLPCGRLLVTKQEYDGREDGPVLVVVVGVRLRGWPLSAGIGGRLQPESVAALNRNGRPIQIGISGRLGPEYATRTLCPRG